MFRMTRVSVWRVLWVTTFFLDVHSSLRVAGMTVGSWSSREKARGGGEGDEEDLMGKMGTVKEG